MTPSRQSRLVDISLLALALASGCAPTPLAQHRLDGATPVQAPAEPRPEGDQRADQEGPAARTIVYRADSFTDPTLDVSPDGRNLYFSAMGEIYVVPITGGLAKALPLGGGWKTRPVISPDGLSIAFLSDLGSGITAWRSPLDMDRPARGEAVPGFEATTLAWVDNDSLVFAGGSTDGLSGFGPTIDYEGEHGRARLEGHGDAARIVGQPASMSADRDGNVFLHRPFAGITHIDGSTGIEDVVVPEGNDRIDEPRVTPDGSLLGFVTMSGGTARLVIKERASGELRNTACTVNYRRGGSAGHEPSYAFIPGQQAVVLERGGRFHRCTFDGVETPIPVEAEVRINLAPRIRPSPAREHAAPGLLDLASTADGRIVAFSDAGHLWIHDRSTGQRRRVSTTELYEGRPAFSADGQWLAYVERFQDQSSTLRILDLESGGSRVLLRSRDVLANPTWSPDGQKIAFIQAPVVRPASTLENPDPPSETILRWLGLDGSVGVVGPIATRDMEAFPSLTWDRSASALLYTQEQGADLVLMSHPLNGEPQPLLSADVRVWNLRVSPSGRFVALATRDGVYVTPVLLSSGDRPSLSWSDIRSMKRLWAGGADHLQWLADDSLIWTVQHRLMRASLDEEPREIADFRLPAETAAEPARRAYVGATVISMDRAGTIGDAVIITRGRTLEYVGPREGAPDLTGIETTDLSGKWIVPGFVDVHAHNNFSPLSEYNLPVGQYNLAELGFGVTTIFDPAALSPVEIAVKYGTSQRDEFIGPTAYGTGVVVMGYPNNARQMDVESYEHALVLASDIAGRGGLMIKNYRQGVRQQRQWLAQAAGAYGLGVTSDEDMNPAVNMPLVMDGYTAIEHEIREDVLREDIKQFLIEAQVSLTPTVLLTAEDLVQVGEPGLSDARRDCLVNPAQMALNPFTTPQNENDAALNARKGLLADYADLLNRGARVTIGGHGEAPGLDFHWELGLLAMGGATPMNLLRAATMNGAEKLGLESRIGSLADGKDADFIVLNANPLDDIRNARNIERVVRRGRVVTWPTGPAPQSWTSAASWDDCQKWNFGLGGFEAPA